MIKLSLFARAICIPGPAVGDKIIRFVWIDPANITIIGPGEVHEVIMGGDQADGPHAALEDMDRAGCLSKKMNDFAAWRDLVYLFVAGVCDEDITERINGDAARRIERRRRCACALRTGCAGKGGHVAVRAYFSYAVVIGIGNVDVPQRINRDRHW